MTVIIEIGYSAPAPQQRTDTAKQLRALPVVAVGAPARNTKSAFLAMPQRQASRNALYALGKGNFVTKKAVRKGVPGTRVWRIG